MDVVADVNGGNAEMAHTSEPTSIDEVPEQPKVDDMEIPEAIEEEVKLDDQEFNGDKKTVLRKKSVTPVAKRNLRKSKTNKSTSTVESDQELKGKNIKTKLSDLDGITSEDSMDFVGFDKSSMEISTPGLEILRKLIAIEEDLGSPSIKRMKRSLSKGPRRNIEFKTVEDHSGILDANEIRMNDATDPLESDESDDTKPRDSSIKSLSTSSHAMVNRRGVNTTKQKSSTDVSNPLFREPFKFGWKREVVYKSEAENPLKKLVEIYYYTPKGKKVRSLREVAENLTTKELSIDNFTFVKESTGINDTGYEMIHDEMTDVNSSNAARKILSASKRGGSTRRTATKTSSPSTPSAKVAGKWSPAAGKTNSSGNFKVKVTGKRGTQKKDTVSPSKDPEVLSPTWSNTSMARRSQAVADKSQSLYKNKRLLKTKVQEPCSIRCALSMGLIPSLQCCVCLCLYHPECVGHKEASGKEEYVCKNCQPSIEENKKTGTSITPPPLIPISMLGSQNLKSCQLSVIEKTSPLKFQKLVNSENIDSVARVSGKSLITSANAVVPHNKMDSTDPWFGSPRRNYFPGEDGSAPKPAQNIARLGGKRYIVVPKNNDMAVQPAIAARPDKIQNLPSLLDDKTTGNAINSSRTYTNLQPLLAVSNENITIQDRNIQKTNDDAPPELGSVTGNQSSMDISLTSNTRKNSAIIEQSLETPADMDTSMQISDKSIDPMSGSDKLKVLEQLEKLNASSLEVTDVQVNEEKNENTKVCVHDTTLAPVDAKKAPPIVEVDQKQFFMSTVSAGYNALSRVFQYLKVQELLRAARVCKMWRDVAANQTLWKTVRMKNSQVTDWDGLVATLQRHGTQHLDLRKMLIAGESDNLWKKFVEVIPNVKSLIKLELCRCPVMVVEEVIKACPQLQVLSAMSIKCDWLNLDSIDNLVECQELRLKAISGMLLHGDLTPLQKLTQLSHLSLTSVKELGKKKIDVLSSLVNLESLELGECSDFPAKFGTSVLCQLTKLERLRLEKGQGTCCTFDILDGISKLEKLHQLELVNFDVKNGFDKSLTNCKNIKRLLVIPTYISQSATSNNMVLGGVTELSNNLTHFVWGVTLELLRVTELFVDQCNQMNKQVSGDSIPVLKPVPCLKLIENADDLCHPVKDEKQPNLANPQVDILPLPQLQKLLSTALPKTRVKILKIPFHATWRQSIADTSP